MRRRIATFTLLFTLSAFPHANAHAQLTDSNPRSNAAIKKLPEFIWVEFDGDLMTFGDKNPNTVTVTNSKKRKVDIGGSLVSGARVSTRLKSGLAPGRYLVSYRVVSEDGHPVQGSFSFRLIS